MSNLKEWKSAPEMIQSGQNPEGKTDSDTAAFVFSFFTQFQFPCDTFTSVWQII